MVPGRGETSLLQACGLAVGCAGVVVAASAAAAFLGPHALGARALVIALVVAAATATVRDWRSCAGVAVFGALVYVGFLAHRDGDLTGDASAWAYTVLITVLAVSGRVMRWAFTSAAGVGEPHLN